MSVIEYGDNGMGECKFLICVFHKNIIMLM
jgi:hypothetical protein